VFSAFRLMNSGKFSNARLISILRIAFGFTQNFKTSWVKFSYGRLWTLQKELISIQDYNGSKMFKRPDRPDGSTKKSLQVASLVDRDINRKAVTVADSAPDKTSIDPLLRGKKASQPKHPKNEKPMTASRINNIAEYYISQRESSTGMIREMFHRRAVAWLRTLSHEERPALEAEFLENVEAKISNLVESGFIDDARFAEMKARSWRNSGHGSRRIAIDLAKKGISRNLIQDAIAAADTEIVRNTIGDENAIGEESEHIAAETLAQRKRLGPYRTKLTPTDRTEKMKLWRREAGVLSRAGFGLDIIIKILDREPEGDDF
jgi:regulatory protein